jgi:predicted  nucleic acid-binding Zn-ribbon protein
LVFYLLNSQEEHVPFSIDPQPGENEIECARCGSLIYDQLSRCPNCGVNLYEPEDDRDDDPEQRESNQNSNLSQKVRLFFRGLFKKPFSAQEVFGDSLDQAFYYNDLLQKVGGDHAVVERLVEFEKKLYPKATRLQWIKNAIQRWERDNRASIKSD